MVRVAINGFGRIGRMVLKAGLNSPDIEFVAVNDLTDTKTLAHLFKYDSVFGKFEGTVDYTDNSIIINGKEVVVLSERVPENLPWAKYNIDVVVESTGRFRKGEDCQAHINAGAKKVVISAPPKGGDVPVFVKGVNEHLYNKETDHIVSNASCTTNCLAPIVKVLNDNFGVRKGFMTTIHSYTGDQKIVDGPHPDLRRARAAAQSIIPTTTGAAIAVTKVIPELEGKLDGLAMRVPTPDGSITDFTVGLKRDVTVEEVNALFKDVSENCLKGVLEYTEEPLVSRDIIGNPHSSIVDASLTSVNNGNMLKIVSWYDNEWGYSNRMIDLIKMLF